MTSTASKLSTQGIVLLIAALVTAAMHLWWGVFDVGFMRILFILNALGYVGLAGAYLMPFSPLRKAGWLRWALLSYTAFTFVAFFAMNVIPNGDWAIPAGPIAKLAELVMIVLLWMDK